MFTVESKIHVEGVKNIPHNLHDSLVCLMKGTMGLITESVSVSNAHTNSRSCLNIVIVSITLRHTTFIWSHLLVFLSHRRTCARGKAAHITEWKGLTVQKEQCKVSCFFIQLTSTIITRSPPGHQEFGTSVMSKHSNSTATDNAK